jgi:hypothetical protein
MRSRKNSLIYEELLKCLKLARELKVWFVSDDFMTDKLWPLFNKN